MLQRGIDYLEAVGDVMSDGRLDVLLLDPVGWFAGFLAHFIRDDGNPPAEVVRGVVSLADVVAALRHEYLAPETQVPEVMALVCNLELCVELSTLERDAAGAGRYLFPCLLPAATPHEIALHWPRAAPTAAAAELIVRGHRFRAAGAFLPPGVFPSLVARLARLPQGWVHSSRLWKDAAVLHFREAAALLRVDLPEATIDITVAAPADACHFVGAAKGQASAVRWLAHLVRQMLARSYAQIEFDECWLSPSPGCHGLPAGGDAAADVGAAFGVYRGPEYALRPTRAKAGHVCEQEGCWNFLGTGHKLEPLELDAAAEAAAAADGVHFPLRAGGGFGWASKEDAELMRAGMSVARPKMGFGCKVGEQPM
jgi:hypothetical protein